MTVVSIHTLHELEARTRKKATSCGSSRVFPFIRFTNWKQEWLVKPIAYLQIVSIHTLHELEASWGRLAGRCERQRFHSYASRIGSKDTWGMVLKPPSRFHSYASRIGSKLIDSGSLMLFVAIKVSIHTLHELEASSIRMSGLGVW